MPFTINLLQVFRAYWTGDRGRLLADGILEIQGRVDSVAKIRGGHTVDVVAVEVASFNIDSDWTPLWCLTRFARFLADCGLGFTPTKPFCNIWRGFVTV